MTTSKIKTDFTPVFKVFKEGSTPDGPVTILKKNSEPFDIVAKKKFHESLGFKVMALDEFMIGERVSYVVAGKVLFNGVVSGLNTDKKLKPYIIKADDGSTKFANPQFLFTEIKPTLQ